MTEEIFWRVTVNPSIINQTEYVTTKISLSGLKDTCSILLVYFGEKFNENAYKLFDLKQAKETQYPTHVWKGNTILTLILTCCVWQH